MSLPNGLTWTEWGEGSYHGIRMRCPSSGVLVSVIWEPDGRSHLGLRDKAGHYAEAANLGQRCAELIVRSLEAPETLEVKDEINPRCDLCGELTEGYTGIPDTDITVCLRCLDSPELVDMRKRWLEPDNAQ